MTSEESRETIPLVVLNSVLYGAAKAVDYLGMRGQVMLDKIGASIIDYLVKTGYVDDLNDMENVQNGYRRFFQQNGYISEIGFDLGYQNEVNVMTITYRGWQYLQIMKKLRSESCTLYACPFCLAGFSLLRANSIVAEPFSEYFLPDGSYVRKYKLVNASPNTPPASMLPPNAPNLGGVKSDRERKVGLGAFEAVEYGLANGFGYLGAQAQLLDRVGRGVVEFLREEFQLSLTGEYAGSIQELASFYTSHGLADQIKVHSSSSEMRVEFQNYRYASVLGMLLKENVQLISCPFTLAARAVLRDAGLSATETNWTIKAERNVDLTMPLWSLLDKSFDEYRVGGLMDSV